MSGSLKLYLLAITFAVLVFIVNGQKCADKASNCKQLTSSCGVRTYASTLKRYCAQSCGECKPTGKKCKDTIKKCSAWKISGFCKSRRFTKQFKTMMCASTCSLCGDEEGSGVGP